MNSTEFDFDDFETQYRHMYTDKQKFFIVADCSMNFRMDSYKLERLIDMLIDLQPKTKTQVMGSAIILTNSMQYFLF